MIDRLAISREAMRAAFQVRRQLSIPRELPINPFDVSQALGVEVFFLDTPSLEGMFARSPAPRILLECREVLDERGTRTEIRLAGARLGETLSDNAHYDDGYRFHDVFHLLATQRRGQAFFRKAVLAAYEGKCCVTGIAVPGLLRASHIVPWSVSRGGDEAQRLNPRNGLCLNAMHDAAFDSGLITLDEDRRVVLSRTLRDATTAQVHQAWFIRYDGQRIADAEKFAPDPAFLTHHRQRVFVA